MFCEQVTETGALLTCAPITSNSNAISSSYADDYKKLGPQVLINFVIPPSTTQFIKDFLSVAERESRGVTVLI